MPSLSLPAPNTFVKYPPGWKPTLIVVIDTEEEFDWTAPLDRNATTVRAMAHVGRGQKIFDSYGIRPTYTIDYPVASRPEGWKPLHEIWSDGRCDIGSHLHPWVTPPHEEEVNLYNSYAANLPIPLVREKLRRLGDQIQANFGYRPRAFKAGRYGMSDSMIPVLKDLGYEVDLSTAPPFDYRGDGGPDYTRFPIDGFWMNEGRRLLSLPTTGAFAGWAGGAAPLLYGAATSGIGAKVRAAGILARLGAVDRIRLSPEDFTHAEHRKVTRFLLDQGVGVLTFSFHSPSLDPGRTPYVRTEADLSRFLDSFRKYFDYFFGEAGGRTLTAVEVKRLLENGKAS